MGAGLSNRSRSLDGRWQARFEHLGRSLARTADRLTRTITGPDAPLAIRRLVGVHIGAFFTYAMCTVLVRKVRPEEILFAWDVPFRIVSSGILLVLAALHAFGDAQCILLPAWAAFSRRSLCVRFGLLLAAALVHSVTFLLIMIMPSWSFPSASAYSPAMILLLLLVQYPLMFVLAAIAPLVLRTNWLRVGTVAEASVPPRWRFRLVTVMAIVTVFALVFGGLRFMDPAFRGGGNSVATASGVASSVVALARYVLFTFVTMMVAMWATLGIPSAQRRLPVFAVVVVAVGVGDALIVAWSYALPFQWLTVRSAVFEGAVVFGSLVVVRNVGFRLVWIHRDASPAGLGSDFRIAEGDPSTLGQVE